MNVIFKIFVSISAFKKGGGQLIEQESLSDTPW